MSNDDTIATTVYSTETFDRSVDPTITLPFTRDKLEAGGVKLEVFTPVNRQQHLHLTAWDAKLDAVDPYVDSTGKACTTLRLVVDGRTVDLALWGVTLDALAVAVEAAQREAAEGPLPDDGGDPYRSVFHNPQA